MDYIEVSGKTVDEALTNALVKLQTTSDKVEYEVIEKGSSGILGIFNTKPAVIRVRKKEDTEEIDIMSAVSDIRNIGKQVKKEAVKHEKRDKKERFDRAEKTEKAEKNEKIEKIEKTEKPENNYAADTKEKTYKNAPAMPKEEVKERITAFLSQMFQAMDMDVQIKVTFDDPECVNIELSGDNMGVLIGKRGQTLDSIQYLTSLVVNKGKNKYVRIKIDTEDYRNRRKETLESLAKNIAYKVKRSRRSVSLEPMNPYERRIIHSALQHDKFVSTRSEGEEPFRHVVVYLDREKNADR